MKLDELCSRIQGRYDKIRKTCTVTRDGREFELKELGDTDFLTSRFKDYTALGVVSSDDEIKLLNKVVSIRDQPEEWHIMDLKTGKTFILNQTGKGARIRPSEEDIEKSFIKFCREHGKLMRKETRSRDILVCRMDGFGVHSVMVDRYFNNLNIFGDKTYRTTLPNRVAILHVGEGIGVDSAVMYDQSGKEDIDLVDARIRSMTLWPDGGLDIYVERASKGRAQGIKS